MSKRAIVFIYDGSEPNVNTLAMMTNSLRPHLEFGRQIESFVLDEKDIAKAMVSSVRSDGPTIKVSKEDNAAIYIGERFANSIKEGVPPFIAELAAKYIFGCIQRGNDDPLKKAVIILSDPDAYSRITVPVRMKYGISSSLVDAIREMYHTTCAGHEIVIG